MNSMKDKIQRFLRTPWVYLLIFMLILGLVSLFTVPGMKVEDIPYSEFLQMVEEGKVESVEIIGNELQITPKHDPKDGIPTYYTSAIVQNDALVGELRQANVKFFETEPAQPISIADPAAF